MRHGIAVVFLCVLGAAARAESTAPIERVRTTDNELTCRQIHTEIGEMDRHMATARADRASGENVATGAAVAGAAAPVAAQAAAASGAFGVAGTLAQLAPLANLFGGAASAGATRQANEAQERLKAAQARKEQLSALFLNKGCNPSDPDAAAMPPERPVVVAGAPGTAVIPAAPVDAAALVASAAEKAAPLDGVGLDTLDGRIARLLAPATRVAVPGFRVVFVQRNAARAYAGAGLANVGQSTGRLRTVTQAQNKSIEIALENVDPALLQAIADRAHADFVARLAAAGKEVLPLETLKGHASFRALQVAAGENGAPYRKSPVGSSKEYAVYSPRALPLWFMHGEALGDQSAFALDNWRGMSKLSFDTGAVVLIPTVVIDFARVESSGNSNFRSRAEVGAEAGMSIEPTQTAVHVLHAKIESASDMEVARLREAIPVPGEFGRTREVASSNDAGVANALTLLTGMQGTQRSRTRLAVEADPARYAEQALRGAITANALFAGAMADTAP